MREGWVTLAAADGRLGCARLSWLLKLHEVSSGEAAEVLAINALAPFIINSRLRPLLDRSPEKHTFVVNVSAMEGKFYRYAPTSQSGHHLRTSPPSPPSV